MLSTFLSALKKSCSLVLDPCFGLFPTFAHSRIYFRFQAGLCDGNQVLVSRPRYVGLALGGAFPWSIQLQHDIVHLSSVKGFMYICEKAHVLEACPNSVYVLDYDEITKQSQYYCQLTSSTYMYLLEKLKGLDWV